MTLPTPLRTNVAVGDPNHQTLHNEERTAINNVAGVLARRGDYIQRLAVPSYFWASWYTAGGGAWARMQAAAPVADICVVNVGSGPGAAADTDFQTQAKLAKAAGMTVLGYVRTNYTAVAASTVKSQVDQHYAWYGVDGIFFDEADNPIGGTISTTLAYYADLYAYVKAKGGTVVINPGQPSIDEGLMASCDVVMNYENSAANYGSAQFPAWTVNYPSRRFWHVIYGVTDLAQRDSLLAQSKARRAGYVYLTDDVFANPATDNPYDTLPPDPFWSGMVAALGAPASALPVIAAAPSTVLAWDGTNGGAVDQYGRQQVNSAQWTYDVGGGETPIGSGNRWGNNELQIYVADRDHVWVKGGQLHIRATRGTYPSPVAGEVTASYASGRIHSQGKVSAPVNSYWECAVQHPSVSGAWGAVWQMGDGYARNADNTGNWPQFGEIDWEWEGHHARNVGMALHALTAGYTPPANDTTQWQHHAFVGHDKPGHVPLLPHMTDDVHTYGVWRSATEVRWYVNRRQVDADTQAQATAAGMQWPFTAGQFFVINLAFGGQLGGSDLDGRAVSASSMGAEMVVGPISIWNNVTSPAALGLQ